MSIYELSKLPLEAYKDKFPITALADLKRIPTAANTPEQLRGILYETDAVAILAGVAIANYDPQDGRFAGPALFAGHPDYFRHYALQRDEEGKLVRADETGSVLAVSGLSTITKGRATFLPTEIKAFGNDGIRFGLVLPINSPFHHKAGQYTSAVFEDGITPSYSSRWPAGEVRAPMYNQGKQSHRFENQPAAVLKCIGEIAGKLYEQEVLRDLDIKLSGMQDRVSIAA